MTCDSSLCLQFLESTVFVVGIRSKAVAQTQPSAVQRDIKITFVRPVVTFLGVNILTVQ